MGKSGNVKNWANEFHVFFLAIMLSLNQAMYASQQMTAQLNTYT